MEHVRGVGGVFFKARDPERLRAWYRDCLGVRVQDWGGATFAWQPGRMAAYTVWSPFSADTRYFAPSEAPFMVNFVVDDLDRTVAQLRERGAEVDERTQSSEFGRFGWVMDPEGNRVELWQPPLRTPGLEEPAVAVFFYGSYMDRRVLAEVDLVPRAWEVATLAGFAIEIRPLANLGRSPDAAVWGILAAATHAELERLYAHARDVLGATYLPEAVMVETSRGATRPALCYICPGMEARPAADDYLERILAPAREHGFPETYLAHLESFRAPR